MDTVSVNMAIIALFIGNLLSFFAAFWVIRKVIRLVNLVSK